MHTKHEGKEEGVVSMVVTQGIFLVGKLVGGNKLIDPRVFTMFEEPDRDLKTGAIKRSPTGEPIMVPKIRLAPLPAIPPFVIVGGDRLSYPISGIKENRNILELYDKVTHPVPAFVTPDISGKMN